MKMIVLTLKVSTTFHKEMKHPQKIKKIKKNHALCRSFYNRAEGAKNHPNLVSGALKWVKLFLIFYLSFTKKSSFIVHRSDEIG